MGIRVLFTIVLLAPFSVFAQTVQLADHGATTPWLAVGAQTVAVVWRQDNKTIDAAILDAHGTLIRNPFVVGTAEETYGLANPRISAIGDIFLVVWQDVTPDRIVTYHGALIDPGGVAQKPFTIASTTWSQRDVVVAGGGTRFIVFWYEGTGTQAAWINTAGVVESTFQVTDSTVVTDAIAAGDTAVAVWDDGSVPDVAGRPDRLAIGLTSIAGDSVLGSRVIASMPGESGFGNPYLYTPAIATDGSGYYVAWHSGRTGREDNVEGTRIAPDLTPLDVDASQADGDHAGGVSIETDFASAIKTLIRVAPAGSRYFVSWTQDVPADDLVRGRYIGANGSPSTYVSFPISLGVWPSPSYDYMATGTTTLLPNGVPVAVYTMGISGRLFVRYVASGPRVRIVRR